MCVYICVYICVCVFLKGYSSEKAAKTDISKKLTKFIG
jgi:hypothetical protein